MLLDYQKYIPEDFADNSRVWIYQASRRLTMGECLSIEDDLELFVKSWNTHQTPVKGFANILFGQFLILMADENVQYVSGCSTDSSVRFVKQLEGKLKINFFDRQLLAFERKDKIETIPMSQLPYALEHGLLTADSLYFNNLIQTKKELCHNWIIPIKDSWLAARYLPKNSLL